MMYDSCMGTWRIITLTVGYEDDADNPRQIDLRGELDIIEQRWTRHLATPVRISIQRDFIEHPGGARDQ
jgi:hypothetical protein